MSERTLHEQITKQHEDGQESIGSPRQPTLAVNAVEPTPAIFTPTHRHYKGGLYQVIGDALHTETEEELVAYINEEGRLFVRPADMFGGTVHHHPYFCTPEAKREKRIQLRGQILWWMAFLAIPGLTVWWFA